MSALALALTRYTAAIAVWDLTFLRLYDLSRAKNQALQHQYRCMRLEELVAWL